MGKKIRIRFLKADGQLFTEAEGEPGVRLLDVAHANDVPLEGTCEGNISCSTCHVIVDKEHYKRLPLPSVEEEDLLDFAFGVTGCSRLACQIILEEAWDCLEVRLPGGSLDMSR